MLWPTESANAVLLQWTTSGSRKSPTTTCKLMYDETHHYLRVVDIVTNDVLDTIDGHDVIGANIAIDMDNEALSSNPRAAAAAVGESTATLHTTNVSGPTMDSIPTDSQAHATLTIYVYPRKPPTSSLMTSLYRTCRNAAIGEPGKLPTPNYVRPLNFSNYGARYAHHRSMIVQPMEELFHVRELVKGLQMISKIAIPSTAAAAADMSATTPSKPTLLPPVGSDNNHHNQPLHYLIVCNPEAGPNRNARQIVTEQVVPMLQQANIETTICTTTHPGHAVELCHLRDNDAEDGSTAAATGTGEAQKVPPSKHPIERLQSDIAYYNGIIVMGGDGTMHEVIQGIQSRSDAQHIFSTIPIGIVGCGTANGLATSLQYTSYMYNNIDPATTGSTPPPYDFTYKGITNDIFAAAKGYTIHADLATYSILESASDDAAQTSSEPQQQEKQSSMIRKYTSFLTFTYGLIAEVDIESERIHWMGASRFDVWAVVRVLFLRTYPIKLSYTTDDTTTATPANGSTIPSITDPIPSTWITIEDKITLFWASQVSHAGCKVYNSPPSKTADGMITIMLIRGNVSRIQLGMILLGLESGTHVNVKGVEWIRCSAYRLEPVVGTAKIRTTYNNIDGEKVEYGPIQGVVVPKAIKYFISPP